MQQNIYWELKFHIYIYLIDNHKFLCTPKELENELYLNSLLRIVPYRVIHEHDKCLYSWIDHPLMNRFLRGPFGCLCYTIKFNMISVIALCCQHKCSSFGALIFTQLLPLYAIKTLGQSHPLKKMTRERDRVCRYWKSCVS